jgi:transcriptional regulator with XRE-family HTH domain
MARPEKKARRSQRRAGGTSTTTSEPPPLIGLTVKTLRQLKRWRQVDLARRAGVAEGTITGVESGRRTQATNLDKIAAALSTTVADLREGRDVIAARAVGLTDEDLRIARLFHQGSTAVKIAVRRILGDDVSDIAERYDRLDRRGQDAIRAVLEVEERNQRRHPTEPGRLVEDDPQAPARAAYALSHK